MTARTPEACAASESSMEMIVPEGMVLWTI